MIVDLIDEARGLSYHDVVIFVNGKCHRIKDNYAYELTCTRVGGWQLWRTWEGKSELVGGEYDNEDFRIKVSGRVICGSASDETEH